MARVVAELTADGWWTGSVTIPGLLVGDPGTRDTAIAGLLDDVRGDLAELGLERDPERDATLYLKPEGFDTRDREYVLMFPTRPPTEP